MTDAVFLNEAIALARENVEAGGRPFGAVLVKGGQIVASAVNRIADDNDPSAHAGLMALRAAGAALNAPRLGGCSVHASGQPCPMSLAGISHLAPAVHRTPALYRRWATLSGRGQ